MKLDAIEEFQSDMVWAYQTKGHVDKAAFVAELARTYNYTASEDNVEHAYERCWPYRCDGESTVMLIDAKGPGRGAFPVTRVYAYDCRDVLDTQRV